ncbi:MAG: hypothetical protein M3O71_16765 [Bacteroidota bacterium]|nr:hypothetical protein [Bacteroidota bacterium]
MYWCKPRLFAAIIFIGGITLADIACRPDVKDTGNKYFDIKGYFTSDTLRLKKLNKLVTKTVTHNGVTETKKVKIANWGQELDMFISADINKPAWKNSYTVFNSDNVLLYKAKDDDLKVREVMIKLDKQKVKWMLIFTRTQNILYKTTERLSYFPDSLYLIQKDQHVKLMGNNHYVIQGLIER